MALGIILAVLVLLEIGNVFVKKVRNTSFQRIWSTAHKLLGCGILLLAVLHLVLTWQLLKQRPFAMYVFGILMILCAAVALVSFLLRRQLQRKWMVLHRSASVGLLLCLIVHVIFGITSLNQYQNAIGAIALQEIDLAQVGDGTYIGECDAGYVYAKVEVVVRGGRMETISLLEHRTERGKPAEEIVHTMLAHQQLQVDAVSGATNSSKVIMQAAQNAVQGNGV